MNGSDGDCENCGVSGSSFPSAPSPTEGKSTGRLGGQPAAGEPDDPLSPERYEARVTAARRVAAAKALFRMADEIEGVATLLGPGDEDDLEALARKMRDVAHVLAIAGVRR